MMRSAVMRSARRTAHTMLRSHTHTLAQRTRCADDSAAAAAWPITLARWSSTQASKADSARSAASSSSSSAAATNAAPSASAAASASAPAADSGAAFTVARERDPAAAAVWKPKPVHDQPTASSRRRAVSPMVLPRWLENVIGKLRGGFGTFTVLHARKLYNFVRAHPLATPTPAELKHWQQEQERLRSADPNRPVVRDPRLTLQRLSLPVGEITRFRLIGLHLWILHKMMLASLSGPAAQREFLSGVNPESPAPKAQITSHQRRMNEHLFEAFWLELTPYLRDTVGEMKVAKSLENVQQYFYTAWFSMDIAWAQARMEQWDRTHGKLKQQQQSQPQQVASDASSPPSSTLFGLESFAASVWRNFFMSDESVSKRDVYRLVYYIHLQLDHLSALNQAPKTAATPTAALDSRDWFWNAKAVTSLSWSSVGVLGPVSEPAEALMEQRLGVSRRAWADNNFEAWKPEINMEDMEFPR